MNKLYFTNNSKKLWNMIKRSKKNNMFENVVNIGTFRNYFSDKFAYVPDIEQQTEAITFVQQRYERLCATPSVINIGNYKICHYIKRLKKGCSPGIDGIRTEHLTNALKTDLPLYLNNLFSSCLTFGIVPAQFCQGLLVPILKKNTLDPTKPNHYRPVTISVTMSKLLEHYILDECGNINYSEHQYGFVPKRGTQMAVSVAHDVSAFCLASGSPTFFCSLDATGAFDSLPHSIMFKRAMDVIPDKSWQILYFWYLNSSVFIKWNGQFSERIKIGRGTRQGGLTSPMIFNLFYLDLINEIDKMNCGVNVFGKNFNIYCYADDILLSSTTVTGLQTLIDVAVNNITKSGLCFNPVKTECVIIGGNPFNTNPKWTINNINLSVSEKVKYLGIEIGDLSGKYHCDSRVRSSNKAFYSLQGAGLNKHGVNPKVAFHIYNTAVKSTILYGCESINISKLNIKKLEICLGKQVKSILGLRHSSRTSPILKAFNMNNVENSIHKASLELLKKCILSNLASKHLHYCLYRNRSKDCVKGTLVSRVLTYCNKNEINFTKYVFNHSYALNMNKLLNKNINIDEDGLVDSVRMLIHNYGKDEQYLLQMLLHPY